MAMEVFFLTILGLALLVFLYFVGSYNALVRLTNQVKNAWSQIDVQLKRRHDLIPNLVAAAKNHVTAEETAYENIAKARNLAQGANGIKEKAKTESELSRTVHQFLVVVERYPELQFNESFQALQEELSATENRIAFARQAYNDQVLFLNNRIGTFPSNIIAGMFNFKPMEYFELEDSSERKVPDVASLFRA